MIQESEPLKILETSPCLCAVVFGIITNSFSALREKKEATDQDNNNICFICQRTKADINATEPEAFAGHTHEKHNVMTTPKHSHNHIPV